MMVCDREFEVLLTCNYKHVLSTGRLKLRLIYISNYESESGKISAQPHTFVMHTYFDSIQIVTHLQNIGSGNGKTAVD